MKRSFLVVLFLAGVFLTSPCGAQNKAVPEQFNYKVDLKEVGTNTEKIAGLDSLLQSFVDQDKVSSIVAKGRALRPLQALPFFMNIAFPPRYASADSIQASWFTSGYRKTHLECRSVSPDNAGEELSNVHY